jgi:hypothetical protein
MPTTRSYRCSYVPKDRNGWPVPCESGVLPFIQVQADNAEAAQRHAWALTGCSVAQVERLEADTIPPAIAAFLRDFDDTVTGPLEAAA